MKELSCLFLVFRLVISRLPPSNVDNVPIDEEESQPQQVKENSENEADTSHEESGDTPRE